MIVKISFLLILLILSPACPRGVAETAQYLVRCNENWASAHVKSSPHREQAACKNGWFGQRQTGGVACLKLRSNLRKQILRRRPPTKQFHFCWTFVQKYELLSSKKQENNNPRVKLSILIPKPAEFFQDCLVPPIFENNSEASFLMVSIQNWETFLCLLYNCEVEAFSLKL